MTDMNFTDVKGTPEFEFMLERSRTILREEYAMVMDRKKFHGEGSAVYEAWKDGFHDSCLFHQLLFQDWVYPEPNGDVHFKPIEDEAC